MSVVCEGMVGLHVDFDFRKRHDSTDRVCIGGQATGYIRRRATVGATANGKHQMKIS